MASDVGRYVISERAQHTCNTERQSSSNVKYNIKPNKPLIIRYWRETCLALLMNVSRLRETSR